MRFSVQPTSARQVVREAGQRVDGLADVVRDARAVDAGEAGSLLVGGAVSVFFEDRAEAVGELRTRAGDVLRGAGEAIEAYEAGDREMAQQTDVLARRGDAGGAGRTW